MSSGMMPSEEGKGSPFLRNGKARKNIKDAKAKKKQTSHTHDASSEDELTDHTHHSEASDADSEGSSIPCAQRKSTSGNTLSDTPEDATPGNSTSTPRSTPHVRMGYKLFVKVPKMVNLTSREMTKQCNSPLITPYIRSARLVRNGVLLICKDEQDRKHLMRKDLWADPELFQGKAFPLPPIERRTQQFSNQNGRKSQTTHAVLTGVPLDLEDDEFNRICTNTPGCTKIYRIGETKVIKLYFETMKQLAEAIGTEINITHENRKLRRNIQLPTRHFLCMRCYEYGHDSTECRQPLEDRPTCIRCGNDHEANEACFRFRYCLACHTMGHGLFDPNCETRCSYEQLLLERIHKEGVNAKWKTPERTHHSFQPRPDTPPPPHPSPPPPTNTLPVRSPPTSSSPARNPELPPSSVWSRGPPRTPPAPVTQMTVHTNAPNPQPRPINRDTTSIPRAELVALISTMLAQAGIGHQVIQIISVLLNTLVLNG